MIKLLSSTAVLALCLMASQSSFAASINAPRIQLPEETQARGVLRASQTADITAAMTGQLLEMTYKTGHYFKAGTLLAKFDCALQEAELAVLLAQHQTQSLKYENTLELYNFGAAGKLDVTLARSEMQHASAEADVIKAQIKNCTVYAPFSGYVTARHMSAFETPQHGQPLYSLQRAGTLELSIIVPSKWISWLKKGQSLEFTVDETNENFKANIIRIGATIDPVSQTLEIIAKPSRTPKALSGMSGFARFKDGVQ